MSIENELHCQLNDYANNIVFPKQLDARIRSSFSSQSDQNFNTNIRRKKKIIALVFAALLLLPSAAMAYNFLLADEIYGSFDQVKKKISVVTMEQYLNFNAKLFKAKNEIGEQQYEQFKKLVKVYASAKLEYGDKNGNIDYEKLPAIKASELKQTLAALMPLFDKLNHVKSSQEILSTGEFDKYIEALMTIETVNAKTGTSGWVDLNKVPSGLREKYKDAWIFMQTVYDKQEGRKPLNINDVSYATVEKLKLNEKGVPVIASKRGGQKSHNLMKIYDKRQLEQLIEDVLLSSPDNPQYVITFYSKDKQELTSRFIAGDTVQRVIRDY